MPTPSKNLIFILGPPGAGKGTNCQRLAKEYPNVYHMSVGQLLRDQLNTKNSHDEITKIIKNCMTKAVIVPIEITCKLIENELKKIEKKVVLIDGFPRNIENLSGFLEWYQNSRSSSSQIIVNLSACFVFKAVDSECISRVLARGESSNRDDDKKLDTIKKRIQQFKNDTETVIHTMQNNKIQQISVLFLDANLQIESVYESFLEKIEKLGVDLGSKMDESLEERTLSIVI